MTEIQKTEFDYKGYLREVIEIMEKSAEGFDGDLQGEANRIALLIKILIRDTDKSPSLFTRLGLKEMQMFDISPDYNPEIRLPFSGLAVVTIGKSNRGYVPRLEMFGQAKTKKVPYEKWITKNVIIDEKMGMYLTRESIVLAVANTIYGLTEPKLNDEFRTVLSKRPDVLENGPSVSQDMIPMAYASVRHIAYEIIKSIVEERPELLSTPQ